MSTSAVEALVIMSDPMRLALLFAGVIVGLALGVIPGLGGIIGLALLIPFTFDMDKYAAFAFLLGMSAVTTTSDTIPAVLFGVPGTAGSAATVLDGHPLAKQGQAGRAFGAAFTASMVGGILGAVLLGLSIPVLRPIMLVIGSPELLAFSIFGLSMVSVLSGGTPMRGLIAACIGLLVAMVGSDPQAGINRMSFDLIYLWEGIPIVPVVLGLFALPEMADLAIARTSISRVGSEDTDTRSGQWQGVRDTFRHWWLVTRVSFIGAGLGAIPGIGNAVVDWVAYGHAMRTEKGAAETFGKGDIRGVLASEGSNNAKDGGGLVPTVAFGVPGSTGMALLLGVFLIHGLTPGPEMIVKNLEVTYSMVWSIALANVLGTGICFMFANQLARLALIRYSIITPMVLSVIFVGAFQGTRHWGDIYALLAFGFLGWFMKRLRWPRPPLILGVVLGTIVERYTFFSVNRYGWEWLWKEPYIVPIVLAIALVGLLSPLLREWRRAGGALGFAEKFDARPTIDAQVLAYLFCGAVFGTWIYYASGWGYATRLGPMLVSIFGMSILVVSFANHLLRGAETGGEDDGTRSRHLDLVATGKDLSRGVIARRASIFLAYILGFILFTALFGMLAAGVAFVIAYMRLEGREPWKIVVPCAVGLLLFSVVVFDQVLRLPWPEAELIDLVVESRSVIMSLLRP
ncbi:MAG: hypothetical protein GEU76_14620 [Alphaproteobacteria bacterium]|nr:hypothetical protein [Alphaproteobacteria bacterium]